MTETGETQSRGRKRRKRHGRKKEERESGFRGREGARDGNQRRTDKKRETGEESEGHRRERQGGRRVRDRDGGGE